MNLPLLNRELQRAGRNPRTYVIRFVLPAFSLGLLGWAWLISPSPGAANPGELARYAALFHEIALVFQFGAALVLSAILTADTFATERRNATLDLLILADFSGFHIVAAKFITSFFHVTLIVISALPLLTFTALFGGINPNQILAEAGLAMALTFFTCAIGLSCSLQSLHVREAFLRTIVAAVACLAITFSFDAVFYWQFRWVPCTNILLAWSHQVQGSGTATSNIPWAPIILVVGGVAALIGTWISLPRMAHRGARADADHVPRSIRNESFGEITSAQTLFSIAAGYNRPPEPFRRAAIVAGVLVLLQVFPIAGWFAALLLCGWGVIYFVRSCRDTGALNDLILTSIPDRRVARILIEATRPYVMAGVPAAFTTVFIFLYVLSENSAMVGLSAGRPGIILSASILFLLGPIAHLVAVRYIALECAVRHAALPRQLRRFAANVIALILIGSIPIVIEFERRALLGGTVYPNELLYGQQALLLVVFTIGPWNAIVAAVFAAKSFAFLTNHVRDAAGADEPSSGPKPPRELRNPLPAIHPPSATTGKDRGISAHRA